MNAKFDSEAQLTKSIQGLTDDLFLAENLMCMLRSTTKLSLEAVVREMSSEEIMDMARQFMKDMRTPSRAVPRSEEDGWSAAGGSDSPGDDEKKCKWTAGKREDGDENDLAAPRQDDFSERIAALGT